MTGAQQEKENEKREGPWGKLAAAKKDGEDGKAQNEAEEEGMEEPAVSEERVIGQAVEKGDGIEIRKDRANDSCGGQMAGSACRQKGQGCGGPYGRMGNG